MDVDMADGDDGASQKPQKRLRRGLGAKANVWESRMYLKVKGNPE